MEITNQIRSREISQILQIEYCLYSRKSSEDDERQAMSIDSQIKEMNDLAIRDGLFIKEIRRESHSAKMSGQRPVFAQILNDIRRRLNWTWNNIKRSGMKYYFSRMLIRIKLHLISGNMPSTSFIMVQFRRKEK